MCVLPLFFKLFDFSDMEEPMRKLPNTQDDWAFRDEANPLHISGTALPSPRAIDIDTWRGDVTPHVNGRLVPRINDIMGSAFSADRVWVEMYEGALHHVIEGGSAGVKELDTLDLGDIRRRLASRAGIDLERKMTMGPRMSCVDYESQSGSVGEGRCISMRLIWAK